RTTGLDVDPSSRYVVASSGRLASESGPLYPPFPANTGTISVIALDRTPIGVSIASKPANPTTATSASFTFASADAVSTVSCSLDGAPLGFCTSASTQTYGGLAPGPHLFTVQAADAAGNLASASYAWTIQQAPVNTAAPTISGTASPGNQLSASTGTWTGFPAPTFTYRWSDCDVNGANCTPISGASSASYTAQSTDVGSTLKVSVTGVNSAGSSTATSAPTVVVSSPPANTVAPSISGTASQGSQLTASNGTWTGTPAPTFDYQWSDCDMNGANCQAISGATSSTYTAQGSDAGATLEVTVTGTNSAGSSSATSGPTAVVSSPPVNVVPPAISGTASQGSQLSATDGTWTGTPAPTFAYQWSDCDPNGANCTAISGATASTYTAVAADVGFTLEVTVTASNSDGSSPATSGPSAVVTSAVITSPPANTAVPSISGSPVEAQTLTASTGTWTGTPAPAFAYQWSDCNASGANCSAISGATSATYTAVAADVGSTLEVTVTGSNSAGSAQAGSNPTTVVSSAPGPVTSLLDNFNRPNTVGPPSPSWSHTVIASTSATSNLGLMGQQATGTSNANGADYWNPQTFGPNSEAWITVTARPTVDQDSLSLGLRIQNPGSASTSGGYQAYYIYHRTSSSQYRIVLRASGQPASVILTSANGPTLSPGDQLLFRAIGSTLELWRKSGTTWTRMLNTTDTTITGAGYLMLSARNTAVRLDNFGGGTLP
ncbi:MAG: hypothetical protein M3Z06_03455, partial [Actinomycetota bacterium]|nr:hypothetical protein [Actinomycetota bacterium]